MKVRVYGPDRGHGSWAKVSRGLRQGLAACGALGGYVQTDYVSSDEDDDLDDGAPIGHDAEIGIYVGPPSGAVAMRRGLHKERLCMIAANSSWLPKLMLESLEIDQQDLGHGGTVTGFVAPSRWGASVLRAHVSSPVKVWRHGVGPQYRPSKRPPGDGVWRVLHMASTHNQRKGTAELIAAWGQLMASGAAPLTSRLRLVCDGPRGFFLDHIHKASGGRIEVADTYDVTPRLELSDTVLVDFYQRHDLVCQPSRAEGFGLVPIEALASGVPVLMTSCTGHAEYVVDLEEHTLGGAILAWPGGPEDVIDDGPGARAPTVASGVIFDLLVDAYERRDRLRLRAELDARTIGDRWSWTAQTQRFLDLYEP